MNREAKKEYDRKRYLLKKEEINKRNLNYHHSNKAKVSGYSKQYYLDNKDDINEKNKRNYLKSKEKVLKRHSEYRKNNTDKINSWSAKRRASRLQATPVWLTNEHLNEITELYTLAKELEWLSDYPLEVDHIVPLQGKNVCGLHVPWNLQILDKKTNRSKSNSEV